MADENQVLVIDGQDEELERWIAFMDVTYTEDAVGAVREICKYPTVPTMQRNEASLWCLRLEGQS